MSTDLAETVAADEEPPEPKIFAAELASGTSGIVFALLRSISRRQLRGDRPGRTSWFAATTSMTIAGSPRASNLRLGPAIDPSRTRKQALAHFRTISPSKDRRK